MKRTLSIAIGVVVLLGAFVAYGLFGRGAQEPVGRSPVGASAPGMAEARDRAESIPSASAVATPDAAGRAAMAPGGARAAGDTAMRGAVSSTRREARGGDRRADAEAATGTGHGGQARALAAARAALRPEVRRILDDPSARSRARALRELAAGGRNDLAFIARDIARLDPSPKVRQAAVETLDRLGEAETLADLAADPQVDLPTREEAIAAVTQDTVGQASLDDLPVSALIPLLDDPDLWADAMDALADKGDPAAIAPLEGEFFDRANSFEKREYTLFALEDLGQEVDEAFDALDIEWEQAELAGLIDE